MQYHDYYDILGVSKDATQDEIKRAYRKLARKYHPDVSKEQDATERFQQLNEAHEVLKDPEKRAAYDRLGSQWQAGQDFTPPPGWDTGFEFHGGGFSGDARFSDFFEQLFGGGSPFGHAGAVHGSAGLHRKGEDHHARILISLDDAYSGARRTIQLQSPVVDANGHVSLQPHTLNVKIPRGIAAGQRIRLGGQGAPGHGGGPKGDLFLEVEFEPHPRFRAEGRDVYLTLPITPWEAALGGKVTAPTLGGNVELRIPAGATSGQKMRLPKRGLPGRQAGDQYVVLQIATPPAESETAKQLYRDMEKNLPFNPRAHLVN